jgi:hypothetical protein
MRKGDSQRPEYKIAEQLPTTNLADVRDLFAQLAANHMRQVRDFMIDLKWGEALHDWVPICEPAVRSLRRAAERLDLTELCAALDGFRDALSEASRAEQVAIAGDAKDKLIASYDALLAVMPEAFALESDRTQREAVIIQSLLLQVPDVRKVTIDKLYGAGLTTLDVMFAATVEDMVATTGVQTWLAERIVERFQTYRRELRAVVPDAARSGERERLRGLVKELRQEHEEYESAAKGWSEDATVKKRQLRQARDATLLEVKVVLARLGEVERLGSIERVPFEKKIAELESFLADATDRYVSI